MKNLSLIVLVALLGILVIQGCDKTQMQDITTGTKLKAAKTQLVVWQTDTLFFTGAGATDSLTWTINPSANANLLARGNTALISFGAAGTYVITAQKAGGLPASVTITVASSTSVAKSDTGTTVNNITTSTSDTLKLVPITSDIIMPISYYRNPAGDSVMVNFNPYTYIANKYCSSGIIQFKSAITTDNHFNLDLVNIRESTSCPIVTEGTTSQNNVFKNKLLGFGTYPLVITVGSVNYTGTIVISALNITINWPYTSGVTFPTTVIPK
ncbi:hypothetical protein [Mucilaginibacter sp. dw_454]|uniref:hypothetical protein n=1 Tax=Mucilaginibacter sp. dw_454 TaxID=2720079 RepID=UPI001BD20DB6|nr:hypothetical protein [Mucilaginibacter sp. dw_454]